MCRLQGLAWLYVQVCMALEGYMAWHGLWGVCMAWHGIWGVCMTWHGVYLGFASLGMAYEGFAWLGMAFIWGRGLGLAFILGLHGLAWLIRVVETYVCTQPKKLELWRIKAYNSMMPENQYLCLHAAQNINEGSCLTPRWCLEIRAYACTRPKTSANCWRITAYTSSRPDKFGTYACTQLKIWMIGVGSYTLVMPKTVGTYACTRPKNLDDVVR